MQSRKIIQSILTPLACLSMVALISACGGQAYSVQTTPTSTTTAGSTTTTTSGTGTSTTTTPTSTPAANLPSPIVQSFQLQAKATSSSVCGSPTPTGVSVGTYQVSKINTDNLFQVSISANAPSALPCSTATMYYSCAQFTVTAGTLNSSGVIVGRSQNVTVSYGSPTTGPCANVPNKVMVDFSDQAVAGRTTPLAVQISAPYIDNCRAFYGCATNTSNVLSNMVSGFYSTNTCQAYGYNAAIASGAGNQYGGCSMGVAYDNYITSGTVSIQTNTQ